ncbi:MAG: hypothetical protein JWM80_5747 [Cyanobacteria bacterium RYN_339]|nr:hypothetical protein [Cyanobacteria bacterium RYN_339]
MAFKKSVLAATLLAQSCAYNATGVAPPRTLIFEFTIEGDQFVQSPNVAYYLVIDGDGDPATGPQANGGVPITFPYPDPRSYLPFIFDQSDDYKLDRQSNIPAPISTWSTFFALYQFNGAMVMYQGRRNEDGKTVNEQFRQLQNGREWGIQGKTVQITVPFTQILGTGAGTDDANLKIPPQLEANLIVANRGQARTAYDLVMERWGQVPNVYFTIPTGKVDQTVFDTISGVPADLARNVPQGIDPRNVNLITYRYRIVTGQ